MIIGIGTDIVEVNRIRKSVEQYDERFLNKIFTEVELKYSMKKKNKFQHLAGRFAAKEAVSKAFGTGLSQGLSLQHIEVTNDDLGVIRNKTRDGEKYFSNFVVEIRDAENDLVAMVKKTIYIRKKLRV